MRIRRIVTVASMCVLACVSSQPAHAIFGMGDTVIICGDLMDTFKWARELDQWTKQINTLTQQVQKADQMINLVGDPKRLGSELIGVLDSSTLDSADDAAGLQGAASAMEFGKSLYGLAAVGKKTLRDADRVGDKYSLFGEEMKRDNSRYAHFSMEQALQARFDAAVKNKEKVERAELALQRKILDQLKDAGMTQNGRIAAEAALTASKARMDMASLKVQQAKDEYDMFTGRVKMEAERKAEANAEESEALLAAMREKARAAMQRQSEGGASQ